MSRFKPQPNHRQVCLVLLLLVGLVPIVVGQNAKTRENLLKSQYGFEKLQNLEWLSSYHLDRDVKKAYRFARQGDQLTNNLLHSELEKTSEHLRLIVAMKQSLGLVQYRRGKYLEAKVAFEQAIAHDPKSEGLLTGPSILHLQKIDSLVAAGRVKDNPFKSITRNLDIGAAINNSKTDVAISTELQLAKMAEKRGDSTAAISHYSKAANLLRNSRDIEQAQIIDEKIAALRAMQLPPDQLAIPTYDTATTLTLPEVRRAELSLVVDSLAKLQEREITYGIREDRRTRLTNYYEAYLSLQSKAQEDSLLQVMLIEQAESEMERLQQANEIADLNIAAIQLEKEAQEHQKNLSMVVAAGVILGTCFILFLYVTKRKKHHKLTMAYRDLDLTKQNLEMAERRIAKMLEQQVSPDIASALMDEKAEATAACGDDHVSGHQGFYANG